VQVCSGSTRPSRPIKRKLVVTIRISERCTGCGACIHVCPARALSLQTERPDGFGRKRAVIDGLRCTGCGVCLAHCRHQALELEAGER